MRISDWSSDVCSSDLQSRQVNVYNWDTYIGETTLDDFTAASGIDVQYDLYADNFELFARLREGNPGYDVIVPTNDMVARKIQVEMIQQLDRKRVVQGKRVTDSCSTRVVRVIKKK